MNLLRILDEARRRLGLAGKPAAAEPVIADPDVRHGLKRPMNRRELFRFTAIAAAVGTPAVRELILSPAKTIAVPPAPALCRPSTGEVIAAQFEAVRPKLQEWYERSEQISALIRCEHLTECVRSECPSCW